MASSSTQRCVDLGSPENVIGQTQGLRLGEKTEASRGGREESRWSEKLMGTDGVVREGEAGKPQIGK